MGPTRARVSAAAISCAVLCACAAGVRAAAGAHAAAATAAPAIAVDRPCYVDTAPKRGAPMLISGSGFAPGHTISVTGGSLSTQATVAADGTFAVQAAAPTLAPGPGSIATKLTATDVTPAAPAVLASTIAHTANLAVSETTGRIGHGRVQFSFSGFTPGKRIYGYYIWHRVVARAVFARAIGPCGTLLARALPYPGGHPKHSLYTVAFESVSSYRRRTFPMVTGRLRLTPG